MSRNYKERYQDGNRKENRHGFLTALLGIVASVCICFVVLVSVAELLLYPLGRMWFSREFDKYSVFENMQIEMSMDEALDVADGMMDYLHGQKSAPGDFFTERELKHLADCREIAENIFLLRWIAVVAIIVLLVLIKALRRHRAKQTIANAYAFTSILSFAGLGYLWYRANQGFGELFEEFHQLMFDNTLYILDPAEDNLINLLPQGFFSDTALAIALMYIAVSVILLFLARKYRKA